MKFQYLLKDEKCNFALGVENLLMTDDTLINVTFSLCKSYYLHLASYLLMFSLVCFPSEG